MANSNEFMKASADIRYRIKGDSLENIEKEYKTKKKLKLLSRNE